VRNKWLRILETTGGRAANITGSSSQPAGAADSRGNGQQQQGGPLQNNANGGGRGRGRGGFQNRGGARGGRGGSRVVPRPVIPPASVSTTKNPVQL